MLVVACSFYSWAFVSFWISLFGGPTFYSSQWWYLTSCKNSHAGGGWSKVMGLGGVQNLLVLNQMSLRKLSQ